MKSAATDPGRSTELHVARLLERARDMNSRGQRTKTQLDALRARVRSTLSRAGEAVLRAHARVQHATDHLVAVQLARAARRQARAG